MNPKLDNSSIEPWNEPQVGEESPISITMTHRQWLDTRAAVMFHRKRIMETGRADQQEKWHKVFEEFDEVFHKSRQAARQAAAGTTCTTWSGFAWLDRLLERLGL